MLFDNMSAAPAASYFIRRERRRAKQTPIGLEFLNLDQEFRVLFCVHSLYDVPTLLDLIQISTATNRMLLVPYLLHLIEFTSPTPSTTAVLYNELEENVDDLDGGQNARLLNESVDLFYKRTGIRLRQLTVESSFADMHIDTCKRAMHVHATMTVVPYHRKTKFDGNMGVSESRVMEFNLKLLERASCTIGIFVDRGIKCWSVKAERVEVMGEKMMRRKVMVLFLGGADDREAVGCAIRLGMHPHVELTVVRFLMAATRTGRGGRGRALANDERSIVLIEREGARDPDEEFMQDVHNR